MLKWFYLSKYPKLKIIQLGFVCENCKFVNLRKNQRYLTKYCKIDQIPDRDNANYLN